MHLHFPDYRDSDEPSDTDKSMLNSFDIEQSEEFKTTKYFYKIHFGMKAIKDEEDHYVDLPKIYEFKDAREKEIMLNRNFNRVNKKVESLVKQTSVSRRNLSP